jgi:hypothetical protein
VSSPPFHLEPLPPTMIVGGDQPLTADEQRGLWELFEGIAQTWGRPSTDAADHHAPRSIDMHSSWADFVRARTTTSPSYVGEYANGIEVIADLRRIYPDDWLQRLLFAVVPGPPANRLQHAKRWVVDEFITVWVVAGGFRTFAGRNHNGYLGGSRFDEATFGVSLPSPDRRPA